jgi:hypothetical protein
LIIAAATFGTGSARGELVDAVAHLGHFRKHHGRAGADEKVRAVAHRGIRGDTAECVASAALHADHELARGHGFALARIEALQVLLGGLHDRLDHRHEAHVLVVLQAHRIERSLRRGADVGDVALVDDGNRARREESLGLELLAPQAHHHHFVAEVRVERDVAHGADRHLRVGRVDRDSAAVGVLEPDHVIHVRIAGEELVLDALHRVVDHPRDALHGLGDREDVAGADGAIGIAVTLEGVSLERLELRRLHGRYRQALERARGGHLQRHLVHPASCREGTRGAADDDVVAPYLVAFREIHERHLVALRHALDQREAAGELRARGQAAVVRNDRDVVAIVHLDVERLARGGVHAVLSPR